MRNLLLAAAALLGPISPITAGPPGFVSLAGSPDLATEVLMGTEVRTGGDTVYCGPGGEAGLEGYFALEYLLHRQDGRAGSGLKEEKDLDASLQRITGALKGKLPLLAAALTEFRGYLMRQDPTRDRVWWPVARLSDLDDGFAAAVTTSMAQDPEFANANLLQLPDADNCFVIDRESGKTELNITQTVIRRLNVSTGQVYYIYNEEVLDRLQPLQLSMIVIHEWLWDFFRPEQINQLWLLNYLLHTDFLEKTPAHELWRLLRGYGFPLAVLGPQPVNPEATTLALGDRFSCLQHAGKVECWGSYLDEGATMPQLTAPYSLVAGAGFACVIDLGEVVCWGRESDTLRQMRETFSALPMPVKIMSDLHLACVMDYAYGSSVCARGNSQANFLTGTLQQIQGKGQLAAFAVEDNLTCIQDLGKMECWRHSFAEPVLSVEADSVQSLAVGWNGICYVDDTMRLTCSNADLLVDIAFPKQIASNSRRNNFCVINDNEVKCLYRNDFGGKMPAPPLAMNPTAITAGFEHFCLLDELGVKCWGLNGYGQTDVPLGIRTLFMQP